MRTLIFSLVFSIAAAPLFANPGSGNRLINPLQKEVQSLFESQRKNFPDIEKQDVTVGFIINAKKEIIVLDVAGTSHEACEYVKKVLNYRKVKYTQARLLTPYTITIKLIKE